MNRRPWLGSSWLVLAACSFASVVSCARDEDGSVPERVVESLIERLQSVHGDPERGRKAVELMSKASQANLAERASRATAASGRTVAPEEMLVPSRFVLRFEPRRYSSEIRGDYSRVTVFGDLPNEVAEVHCVREDGRWQVELDWPPLPPIEKRQ